MFDRPTIRSLLNRTFDVFGAGFMPFMSLALIVQMPMLVLGLLGISLDEEMSLGAIPLTLGLFLLTTCLSMIATAALVYGVFQGLRGESMSLEKCFQLALARWPQVIGLSLLTAVVVVLGMVLCIIPGIVASVGLFVAAPVLMVERKDVVDSMNRSWYLTDGYRVTIFLAVLCLGIIQWVLAFVAGLVGGLTQLTFVIAFVNFLASGFSTALNAVASAVVYHDLRGFREGLGDDELVAMFD